MHLQALKDEGPALAEVAFLELLKKHSAFCDGASSSDGQPSEVSPKSWPVAFEDILPPDIFDSVNGSWVSKVNSGRRFDSISSEEQIDPNYWLDKISSLQGLLTDALSWTDWFGGNLSKRDFILSQYVDGLLVGLSFGHSNRGCSDILRAIDLEILDNLGQSEKDRNCRKAFAKFFEELAQSKLACRRTQIFLPVADVIPSSEMAEIIAEEFLDQKCSFSNILEDIKRNSPLADQLMENFKAQAEGDPGAKEKGAFLSKRLVDEIKLENESLSEVTDILQGMAEQGITKGRPELLKMISLPRFGGAVDPFFMLVFGHSYFKHHRGNDYPTVMDRGAARLESAFSDVVHFYSEVGRFQLAVANHSWAPTKVNSPGMG